MEHARMIAAQRQAKDDEIVRLRERCRILELSKAEYDDLLDVKDNELAAQDDEIERLQRENEQLRKELADKIHLLAESSADIAALKASTEPVAWMSKDGEDFSHKKSDYFTQPLYTTPPTATALVEDFWKRPVEECRYWGNNHAADTIESLPLIGEKHAAK